MVNISDLLFMFQAIISFNLFNQTIICNVNDFFTACFIYFVQFICYVWKYLFAFFCWYSYLFLKIIIFTFNTVILIVFIITLWNFKESNVFFLMVQILDVPLLSLKLFNIILKSLELTSIYSLH